MGLSELSQTPSLCTKWTIGTTSSAPRNKTVQVSVSILGSLLRKGPL